MSDLPITPDVLIEEIKAVSSTLIGDLMSQIAIQRAINRHQEQTIIILRKRVEELTAKE